MNNPFSYEPHPLCIEACKELQAELSQRNDWREEIDRGKMFGVLIVEADNGKIGYLRAYSGQIGGRSDWEGFVPAVFPQVVRHILALDAHKGCLIDEIGRAHV